jgi:predicted nucleotidyltransferase
MTSKVRQVLAELHTRLKGLHGDRLVRLVLFGSQARGDARPDSDIDIMLVLKDPVSHEVESDRVVPITAELSLENDVVISTIYMSAERYARERSSLLLNVREEGVAV